MKILLPFCIVILLACQHQSIPVITDRKAEKPKRIVSVYAPPGTVTADTSAGKTLFMASCSRCHGLPEIRLYREPRWEGILLTMIPKTRLNEEQAVHVRAYVLANAVK